MNTAEIAQRVMRDQARRQNPENIIFGGPQRRPREGHQTHGKKIRTESQETRGL